MRTREFDKIKPYTYFIQRKSDGMKYHGVRWGNKISPNKDFGKKYFGSSVSSNFSKEFENNKNNFIYRLAWTFENKEDAINYEVKINKKIFKKNDWANKNAFPAIHYDVHPYLGKKRPVEFKKKLKEWNLKYSPRRGIKHSEETILKIKNSLLGKTHTEQSKIKMSKNRKGKCSGSEHPFFGRKLNSSHPFILACKAKKGVPLSENHKKKVSISNLGKKHSLKAKIKISNATRGKNNPMFGKKHSHESILKMKEKSKKRWTLENRLAMSGQNHHNKGKSWTEDHKKKIGNSVRGKKNGMFGRKHSKETRKKIRVKAILRKSNRVNYATT